jgi:hypothetical protein
MPPQVVDEGDAVLVHEDRHFPVKGALLPSLCASKQSRANLGGEDDTRHAGDVLLKQSGLDQRRSEEETVIGMKAI